MNRKQHAICAASKAHRWLICPPSARLEDSLPDVRSDAADEGTYAHNLASWKLSGERGDRPESNYYSHELDQYVDDYVSYVLELGATIDNGLWIEKRIAFGRWVPEGSGTADAIVVKDDYIHIIDLKYGLSPVSAKENPQLRLYALGALQAFNVNASKVTMTIFQPRICNIDSETLSKSELLIWGANVVEPKAKLAFMGEGEFKSGEHCTHCRARPICRAYSQEQLKLVEYEFALPPLLTDEEVDDILIKLDTLFSWGKAVRDYALNKAIEGKVWSGYKLIESQTHRKFKNEEQVEKACKAAGYYDIWETKLLSVHALERKIGEHFFEILGKYVYKPMGKPTLVARKTPLTNADTDFT